MLPNHSLVIRHRQGPESPFIYVPASWLYRVRSPGQQYSLVSNQAVSPMCQNNMQSYYVVLAGPITEHDKGRNGGSQFVPKDGHPE